MRLIRIFLAVILLVLGSILGDGYKNNLYLIWLTSSAFLIVYAEFITTTLMNTQDQLDTYKDKVSTLTMLKGNGGNIVQMSIIPQNKIIVGREVKIDLYTTFAVPVSKIPDLKIKTDTEWDITISHQSQHKKNYAGKFEYILNNPLRTQIDDKFIKYSFYIQVNKVGQQSFKIEIDNGTISGELVNSFTVHAA